MFGGKIPTNSFNFGNILNSVSKVLNVANQAIPLYNQAKPMINNAKSAFSIVKTFMEPNNDFKKKDEPKDSSINVNSNDSRLINSPKFFL